MIHNVGGGNHHDRDMDTEERASVRNATETSSVLHSTRLKLIQRKTQFTIITATRDRNCQSSLYENNNKKKRVLTNAVVSQRSLNCKDALTFRHLAQYVSEYTAITQRKQQQQREQCKCNSP